MRMSFVLAAGGTGGHVFPAEALAAELLGRGSSVHLLSDGRVDAFAGRVPGIDVHRVRAGRFGGSPGQAVKALAELALGILQTRRLLRRLAPARSSALAAIPRSPRCWRPRLSVWRLLFTSRTLCSAVPIGCLRREFS